MKTKQKTINRLLLCLFIILALAGCQSIPLAFSPESAAQQEVVNNHMPDFSVDPSTIQVLQTVDLAEKKIVLISFQGNRVNSGRESCLFSYEVRPVLAGGWQTGSGGGGCGSNQNMPNQQPISIGGGKSGGGRNDMGYSSVSGEVFDNNVAAVQVTWNDGAVQQASVVNHSYLIVRPGQFDFSKVEALDAQQKPVFTNDVESAPGKQ